MASVRVRVDTLAVSQPEQHRLAALLSRDERARADRFRFEDDRRRFIVRRARLREWLAEALDEHPDALDFEVDAFGKPALASRELAFSVSHSADLMILATSEEALGCDVEQVRPIEWRELAASFFAKSEMAALARLPEVAALPAFYRCWTCKEAVVKALGLGLLSPLNAFAVSVAGPLAIEGLPGWSVATFNPAPGFAGAVALREAQDDSVSIDLIGARPGVTPALRRQASASLLP